MDIRELIQSLPNGRYVAVVLSAQTEDCNEFGCGYAGDKINVDDITNDGCARGTVGGFSFGELDGHTGDLCGYRYAVSVSAQPNAIVTVTYNQANIAIPVALLYRGRALAAVWARSQGETLQVGDKVMKELTFDQRVLDAVKDPNVNPLSLVPSLVTVIPSH